MEAIAILAELSRHATTWGTRQFVIAVWRVKEAQFVDMKTNVPCLVLLILFTFFAPLPRAYPVFPPPIGGYPGGNTAEGQSALLSLTTGSYNAGIGAFSLLGNATGNFNTGVGAGTLLSNTADENTATGAGALLSNTTGALNTAQGAFALFSNTTGGENTANGFESLFSNATGGDNTAIGDSALFSNTTGSDNTAIGYHALFQNTGDLNTATGWSALNNNTTGAANTADGLSALLNNTTGSNNTAIGETALQNNSTGDQNTATGHSALAANTIGRENTAIGSFALQNSTGNVNTAVGDQALQNCTSGQGNIAIGGNAGSNVTTATAVICLGASGENVNNTTWISGIFGATVPGNAVEVFISPEGQLAAVSSSRRFKKEIKSMDKASESILALKPVTFHYKSDKTNTSQFGLIAEEVAEVNQDLIVRDKNGEIYSVRYDAVNAMLLNEFLKEHSKVEKLEATVAKQHKDFEAALADLKGQIQKVSAQLELSKSAPQTVLNQ